MDALQSYLLRFMEGADKRFSIPVYQRNYDWKKEHCETLMDDLISVYRNNISSHFFGSIVFVGEELASGTEFCIIDGQQRLTTISLLLLAIYNYVTQNNLETNIINPRKIKDSYLVDEYAPEELKLKLKLAKNDKDAYERLFKHETTIESSSITGNYNYFYNRISNMEISELDGLFSAIQKLLIVKISINPSRGDDPQLIFESLNSTGLELEEADKVRNYVLMGLNSELQTECYNKYWSKIELLTGNNVSAFLRYYLAIKEQKLWPINKLYKFFKDYVLRNNFNNDITLLLKDLLKYANYYNLVITTNGTTGYAGAITRIKMLDFTIVYPFAMELFEAYENKLITSSDLDEIFLIIESYMARRIICGIDSGSLNKMFAFMGQSIKNLVLKEKISYLVAFKYTILNKIGHYRFPRDNEFEEKFINKDVYSTKSNYKKYFLAELENYDNQEKIDVYGQLDTGELTIEHIMPQTLSDQWKQELGEQYESIHSTYLHTIGNLTLTGYNSKYSNLPFNDKCTIAKGFQESRLYLNKYISKQSTWNETTILNRAHLLFNRATNIWPLPECSFSKVTEENWISLDEDAIDYTGKSICQYKLLSDIYPVSDWTTMYKNVCKALCKLDRVAFVSLANKEFPENKSFEKRFSTTTDNMRNPYKLENDLYIETNLNTQTKIDMLRVIFSHYNIDFQDLSFKLNYDDNNVTIK